MKKSKKIDTTIFEKNLKRRLKNPRFREAFYMSRLVREISWQISELRSKKHLTQKQLADRAHVPQQEISKIEKGERNITIGTLEKIAAGFGGTVDVSFKL